MIKVYFTKGLKIEDNELAENLIKHNISNINVLKEQIIKNKLIDFALKEERISSNIIKNEFGKPYFENNELFFNVSHTNDYVLFAISKDEIGVDIEDLNRYKNNKSKLDRIKSRICNSFDFEEEKKGSSIIRIWTIKESFLKCIGLGLVDDINDIFIDYDNHIINYKEWKNYHFHTFTYDTYQIAIVLTNEFDEIDVKFIEYEYK